MNDEDEEYRYISAEKHPWYPQKAVIGTESTPHRQPLTAEFSEYMILFYLLAGINIFAFIFSIPVANALSDGSYAKIIKSFLTPPDFIFAPVWTALYCMMAFAAWRVWMHRKRHHIVWPLILFFVQLCVNFAWTPIFFGMREYLYALIDLAALAALVTLNTRIFINIDRTAGALMIPYLLWLFFAMYLNAYVVLNN